VPENASLAALPKLTRAGFVRRQAETQLVQRYTSRLRVKTPSLDSPVAG
jgi:ABC-type sugar transport system ATPase subunit